MNAILDMEQMGFSFSLRGDSVIYTHNGERPAPDRVRRMLGYLKRHNVEVLEFLRKREAHRVRDLAASTARAEALRRWPDDPPPSKPCRPFGTGNHRKFWRRPTGGWVCATCHPAHPDQESEQWTLK